jgi:hypothetical protein
MFFSKGDLQDPEAEACLDLSPLPLNAKESEDIFTGLVNSLSLISEHSKGYGVPPPKDIADDSFLSISFKSNDSLLLDEISLISEISEIKEKNAELRNTVRAAVKNFRDTSKEFMSQSILVSEKKSVLVNELENIKHLLVNAIEENKAEKSMVMLEGERKEKEEVIKGIHDKIMRIQEEVRIAAGKLEETEAMIFRADKENANLVRQLEGLDESLGEIVRKDDEGNDVWCKCQAF